MSPANQTNFALVKHFYSKFNRLPCQHSSNRIESTLGFWLRRVTKGKDKTPIWPEVVEWAKDKRPPRNIHSRKPVLNLETGETYSSVREAALKLKTTVPTIRGVLKGQSRRFKLNFKTGTES